MFLANDVVRILSPFDAAYPDTYTVKEVKADGTVTVVTPMYPDGGDFDPIYLEKV